MSYNVVFQSKEGIRTWTSYPSRDEFLKMYTQRDSEHVIAQGVTEDDAVLLIRQTTGAARFNHALRGILGGEVPEFTLMNAALAADLEGHFGEFLAEARKVADSN